MRVLLMEDDHFAKEFIQNGFMQDGIMVETAGDRLSALRAVEQNEFDVILLDARMTSADAYGVLSHLRSDGNLTPLIIISSSSREADKLKGLDMGADDYVVKPFVLAELVARVRAVARRTADGSYQTSDCSALMVGKIRLHLLKREVTCAGRRIHLTKIEFDLLESFMRRPGQVLSRATLEQRIFTPRLSRRANALAVHIRNIRIKIDQSCIRTVRGCGYSLKI